MTTYWKKILKSPFNKKQTPRIATLFKHMFEPLPPPLLMLSLSTETLRVLTPSLHLNSLGGRYSLTEGGGGK